MKKKKKTIIKIFINIIYYYKSDESITYCRSHIFKDKDNINVDI